MRRQSSDGKRPAAQPVIAYLAAALMLLPVPLAILPSDPAQAVDNEITAENSLPGSPPSEWDIRGSGDQGVQGYATQISVNQGERVD
jgi:hypothetical protein